VSRGVLAKRAIICNYHAALVGRLVFPQPNVDRVAKQPVRRPGQIGDLGDMLWLDPTDAGKKTMPLAA
jgi:hypothetical protein